MRADTRYICPTCKGVNGKHETGCSDPNRAWTTGIAKLAGVRGSTIIDLKLLLAEVAGFFALAKEGKEVPEEALTAWVEKVIEVSRRRA